MRIQKRIFIFIRNRWYKLFMNLQRIFGVFLAVFLMSQASAQSQSSQAISLADQMQTLSSSLAWKKLLHYQKKSWGTEKSLIDGPGFFFSPNGAQDPLAEMQASIQAFQSADRKVGIYKLHPQCAFPARLSFLKKRLALSLPTVLCPQLDEFIKSFRNPQNISIVFSSAYIQNPASMFGHTFLKINTHEGTPLKDIGINYAARVADYENPFAFIYFGITGGYVGQWSTENYFNKVRDYAQGENRDLWEYEINLTPEETKQFIYHLWEIETNAYFYYYFFDENCSYQILGALEAIKPEWSLLDHHIYFIPGESLKNLFSRPDIVKSVKLRPSHYRQVGARYDRLDSGERAAFQKAIQSQQPDSTLSAHVLETLMWYMDYLTVKKKGKLSASETNFHQKILLQRAALGRQPEFVNESDIPAETRADLGHDSYALFLSQGVRDRQDGTGAAAITKLRWRSSYHDVMNRDAGYKKNAQIEFPSLELMYDSDLQKARIESATFLNITSLPPLNFLSWAPAWKVDFGLNTARDYGCLTCRHLYADLGIGGAIEPQFDGPVLLYGLLTLKSEFYRQLDNGYRLGPGFETGLFVTFRETIKWRLSYSQYFILSDIQTPSSMIQKGLMQWSYYVHRNAELRWTSQVILPRHWSQMNEWSNDLAFVYFFK